MSSAAGLTAVSAEVRRRKLDELWRCRQEQAQKLRAIVAAAVPAARPARESGRRSQLQQRAGRDHSGTGSGERQPDAPKVATGAAADRGKAADDDAELERRLHELEEELQSLLDMAGGTEGEVSR